MNQNCVISSVFASGSYSDSTYLSYNSEKKLIAAVNNNTNSTYTYFDNSYVKKRSTNIGAERDSFVVLKGNLLKEVYFYSSTGSLDGKQTYTYNSDDVLTQYTDEEFSPASVTIYNLEITNGNITKISEGSTATQTVEYYTDKPAQTGDYIDLFQMFNIGYARYFKSKNLIKSIKILSSGETYNFTYTFDNDDRIINMTYNTSSTSTNYDINYICD